MIVKRRLKACATCDLPAIWAFQFHLCSAAAGAVLDTLDPQNIDLLFPFVTFPLRDKVVDRGHDDYYDHGLPCRDMADSPFWNG